MQPRAYMDMRVVPSHKAESPSGMAHDIMALLVKFTHAITARKGFKHGLAFPQLKVSPVRPSPGNLVRIFALEKAQIEAIADELEKQNFVRDYVSMGRVKALPEEYLAPGYIEYLRFRVPNKGSGLEESRVKRMKEADSLPYLRINSSTGRGFSLFVKPIRHATANCSDTYSQPTELTFNPDIYGLSGAHRRFALPVVPEDHWPDGQA